MNLSSQNLNAFQQIAADREAQMLRRRWVQYVERSLQQGDRAFSDFGEWCQAQGANKPAAHSKEDLWAKVEAARDEAMRAKQAEQPEPPSAA